MKRSQSNVGSGMVPCGRRCQCNDCTIIRLNCEIRRLRDLCMDIAQRGISPEHARRLINGAWAEAEEK